MASTRGPLPLSKAEHEARGNTSHRPLPPERTAIEDEPLQEKPPKILGPAGAEEWKRIKPALEKAGRWKSRFYQMILQYCLAYEDLEAARKIIRKEGIVLGEGDEERELHPAFKVQKDATDRMTDGIKHLGLSPMQEIRIGGTAPEAGKSTYDSYRRQK